MPDGHLMLRLVGTLPRPQVVEAVVSFSPGTPPSTADERVAQLQVGRLVAQLRA